MTTCRILTLPASRFPALVSTLVLLTALVLLMACAPRAPLFVDATPVAPAPKITVLQADVLVIDGQAVRLADAVTPQPSPDARCAAEALAARQATLRLRTLTSGVTTVRVTPTGARDGDDRPYAHVLLDGADPAHDLIENGLAVTPGGQPFDWCGPISSDFARAAHIATLSFSGA